MTQPNDWMDPTALAQWEIVQAAGQEDGIDLQYSTARTEDGTTPAFIYERNCILVRDGEDYELVIGGRNIDADPVDGRGVQPDGDDNVRLYYIGDGENAEEAAFRLNNLGLRPGGPVATPNHLVSVCPVQICSGGEPVPAAPSVSQWPSPLVTTELGGDGVRVEVLDTGLVPDFLNGHRWLDAIENFDHDTSTFGPSQEIRYEGAHGTFVTGVLRSTAPATDVRSRRIFRAAGVTMEDKLGDALVTALANEPHIISLSAGGTSMDGQPFSGLAPFYSRLTRPGVETLLVAAAGNNGSTAPFYPAAYAGHPDNAGAVVSVGALRYDGAGRACFSNHGDWVKVYALGERHINAFTSGDYTYVEPPNPACRFYPGKPLYGECVCVTAPAQGSTATFHGMAQWSGTSFATPMVAGLIATHMSRTGEMNARTAAMQVLGTADTLTDADGLELAALTYGL